MWGEGSELPAPSGASIQVWEPPDLGNHSPCSVQISIISSHQPNKGTWSLSGTGGRSLLLARGVNMFLQQLFGVFQSTQGKLLRRVRGVYSTF